MNPTCRYKLLTSILFFLACVTAVTCPRAFAAEEAYELPEVVVTANRIPIPRDKIGSAVTVITGEEIEKKKLRQVQDVLRQATSVDIRRFGGPGRQTDLRLRGASPSQSMVLIDGVPMRRPTSDEAMLAHFSTDNIDRIEIVRGNQSTLYGSNAIGGVINIITKRGTDETHGQITTEIGSWQSKRAAADVSSSWGKLRYSLGGSYYYTGGLSAADEYNNPGLEDDIAHAKNFSLAVSYPLTSYDFDASVRYSNGLTAGDANTADTGSLFGWLDQLVVNTRFSRVVNDHYDFKLDLGYSYDKEYSKHFEAPGSANNFHRYGYIRTADFQHTYRLKKQTFTFGWVGEESNGKNVGRSAAPRFVVQNNLQRSWYLQDLVEWRDWTFTLGGRVDHIETDSGPDWIPRKVGRTFRVSAANPLSDELRLHASVGTGFNKPTFNQTIFPSANVSNPFLKPERSKSWDGGLEFQSSDRKFRLDATYFIMQYKDMITRQVANGASVGPNLNVGKANSHGFEIEGNYNLSDKLSMSFNATFLQSNLQDTFFGIQPEFVNTPDKKASGTVHYAIHEKFDVLSTVRFIGKRWSSNLTREQLSQAVLTNVICNYRPYRNGEWSFRVENVFNEVNYESIGFSPVPRNTWLSYTWKQ